MAAGGGLARPEPTGYGHTDSEWVDDTGLSHPRQDLRHVNEDRYEPWEWGEARDEKHRQPGRKRRVPADEPERLKVQPDWPTRTEASMKYGGWRKAFFAEPAKAEELVHGAAGAERQGLQVEKLETDKLERYMRAVGRVRPGQETPKGEGAMPAKGAKRAKSDGIKAGHKKIIDALLEKEDARPTGEAVRLAESDPRKEFTRYQIPTDRGIKDIEIWGDRVKVRSEALYGFAKSAQDDMDGLPDRVAPPDDEMLPDLPEDIDDIDDGVDDEEGEAEDEGGGLLFHVDISVDAPDGMEEEEVISLLDEALRDPEVSDKINERLADTGLSLSVLEVETYEEDECEQEGLEDEMAEGEMAEGDIAEEVVDPSEEGEIQEGSGRNCG